MKISDKGLDLIKEFEGLRLTAYVCPAGVLTIGYGSTGSHVKSGMTITKEEAETLLRKDVARFEDAVDDLVKVTLNQGQFDALVSFAFNLGTGALAESTLLRLLNNGDYEGAAAQFDRWCKAGAVTLEGLVRRRDAEEALFRSGGTKSAVADRAEEVKVIAKVKAKQNTLLKKEPVDSAKLGDDEKVAVEAGKEFSLVWQGKEGDDHVKVSLAFGGGNWFLYAPHWEGLGGAASAAPSPAAAGSSGSKVLDVPYFSQRDNIASGDDLPHRTCFSSSCAMLAKFLKPDSVKGDDDYIQKRKKFGDSTDAGAQVKCLNSLGLPARFVQNGNNALLRKQVDAGKPVPVGILHKGPSSAPQGGGHWLIVIGYEDDAKAPGGGWFIVNDPWGSITHSTGQYDSTNGKRQKYSYALFNSRWTVASDSDGWCIIV